MHRARPEQLVPSSRDVVWSCHNFQKSPLCLRAVIHAASSRFQQQPSSFPRPDAKEHRTAREGTNPHSQPSHEETGLGREGIPNNNRTKQQHLSQFVHKRKSNRSLSVSTKPARPRSNDKNSIAHPREDTPQRSKQQGERPKRRGQVKGRRKSDHTQEALFS